MATQVDGLGVRWYRPPHPGDMVLWAHGPHLGRVISWWTESAWSHAGMILMTRQSNAGRDLGEVVWDPDLIEVSWRNEVRRLSEFQGRHLWIVRPRIYMNGSWVPAPLETGRAVAEATAHGIGRPGEDYPVLDLLAHALSRRGPAGWLRRQVLRRDPDGVCSVVAAAEWASRGVDWLAWDDESDDYRVIRPRVDGISPAEIAHHALRGHCDHVAERPVGIARS